MRKSKDKHSFEWGPLIEKIKKQGIRNVLTTTVAPTGTLSMIADCSNGMEPAFALVFEKESYCWKILLYKQNS